MKNYYWSMESWGDAYPPENADEIITLANAAIDRFIDENGDDDAADYSNKLWDEYCNGAEPKTVYEAVCERKGDSFDLALTFDLDEAKQAIRRDFNHLTKNERANSNRRINVIRGFGATPAEIVDSHLVGLGYIDFADFIEFDDKSEQFF